jgi:hypothetical protein
LTERLHVAFRRDASRLPAVEKLDQLELGPRRSELGIEEPCDLARREDGPP